MKKFIAISILALSSLSAYAQVQTECTTNGNYTSCTSVDTQAQAQANYQAGQAAGAGLVVLGVLTYRGVHALCHHSRAPKFKQTDMSNFCSANSANPGRPAAYMGHPCK
jgi:hypothetical protein